ncbi:polymorphic toxin type 25 domain-containing protein [Pantoea cypripedii]|uniref:polymorphic toxin type 25 domain-containing protein n=1 Tax=Pantoea cypripedii TaxID=55209 RepID=UPI0020C80A1F|nr:polymorphic toxin type 25 domain-containing protein [Pantoea cypripedii]
MVASAVAGALGGLSAGNIGAAASGAMAPYIANEIKQKTTTYYADGTKDVNVVANTMAHAVAGAVLAQLAGNSAAAGAAGAASGELIANAIVKSMYPNTDAKDLTESQKQTVSALSQLAAGLAGGMASDSALGAGTGTVAGKNAVENNALGDGFQLPTGMMNYGQAVASWNQYAVVNNLTPEQTQEGMNQIAIGEGPSWGAEGKVSPTGQISGDFAIGTGYTLTGSIDDKHFSVDGGSIYGLGAHAGASIGLTFGPYFPGVFGNPEHDYSLNIGAGVVSFGATGNKDGIGFSFGVGPS